MDTEIASPPLSRMARNEGRGDPRLRNLQSAICTLSLILFWMTVEHYFAAEGDEREEYLGSLDAGELLQLGMDLYNAGHFWNAHEAWEEVWLESERGMRNFYQGLIQVSAGFVHVTRNRYPGGVKLLGSGIEKLEFYRGDFMGLDLAGLVAEAKAARARLIELGEPRIGEFDRALIPTIRRIGT